ncbi:hypothetical protein ACFL6I_19570 [candidate division KSB1 bacterium]
MKLQTHFIVSLFISIALFPLFSYASFLVLIGGFFIDSDHYLYYIIKKKDISLKRAYNFCAGPKKRYSDIFCIFHHIEFLILMIVLSYFSRYIMIITIGIAVHFLMDLANIHLNKNLKEDARGLSIIARILIKKK